MRSAELERNDEQNLSGIERNEILTNSHLLIGVWYSVVLWVIAKLET